ncbi:MetQ/NlpA family ABC transporter substrate-binding protein [Pseudoroseomonas globiformis]|uniref:Lipoprotein n=1 Tax=Teichococcus globiformis TaxID=2307229 RepID=A0ABV7FVZ2_9PROT
MPDRRSLLLAGGALMLPALIPSLLLPGRPVQAQEAGIGTEARPLRIGVTAGPHAQVMEKVRDIAARDGLIIRIFEFSDYVQPNMALDSGDLDANSFQTQPFLDQTVRDRRLRLVSVAKTLTFPMGIYSRRLKSVDALPNGGRIAIPNDPTQGGRGLLLFAQAGAIRLPPNPDVSVNVADIVENPKRLRILELEAAQLPRALDDVDAAAINTNFAITAGLQPTRDAIAIEGQDSPYSNRIVVRQGDEEKPWVGKLVRAYQNDEVRNFVAETFSGSVIPGF